MDAQEVAINDVKKDRVLHNIKRVHRKTWHICTFYQDENTKRSDTVGLVQVIFLAQVYCMCMLNIRVFLRNILVCCYLKLIITLYWSLMLENIGIISTRWHYADATMPAWQPERRQTAVGGRRSWTRATLHWAALTAKCKIKFCVNHPQNPIRWEPLGQCILFMSAQCALSDIGPTEWDYIGPMFSQCIVVWWEGRTVNWLHLAIQV